MSETQTNSPKDDRKMIYISSQRYRNENIVNKKKQAGDFNVYYVQIDDDLRVVVDGHHSHEAAKECGVEPTYIESELKYYKQDLIEYGFDGFLEMHHIDSAYYDINTGIDFF